ncbi:MAG: pyruvoyl-dependent arginine decarboxylase [Natronomonas sp.]
MNVDLVWGTGDGDTALGSFDRALADANLHNYNLVTLSSVLPADAEVVERGELEPDRWPVGTPLAVVLARHTGVEPGQRVAAGLGWETAAEGGVFMEQEATSREACEHDLLRSLSDARTSRDWDWNGDATTRVVETTVTDVETVVVAAVYRPLSFN